MKSKLRRGISKIILVLAIPVGILIPFEYVRWATPAYHQMLAEATAQGMLLNASSPASCAWGMAILITFGMLVLSCYIYPDAQILEVSE